MNGQCHWKGCHAIRRETDQWYVVHQTATALHVYTLENATKQARECGRHFCGLLHTLNFISQALTPDKTDPHRESTLELKPPLTRETQGEENDQ